MLGWLLLAGISLMGISLVGISLVGAAEAATAFVGSAMSSCCGGSFVATSVAPTTWAMGSWVSGPVCGQAMTATTAAAAARPSQAGRWRGRRRVPRCGARRDQASRGGASSGSALNASLQSRGSPGLRAVVSGRGRLRVGGGYIGIGFEQGAQAAAAARELRFGETRSALHQRGDLLVGVALGVVQPQHAAGRGGQAGERTLQHRRVGRRGRWR